MVWKEVLLKFNIWAHLLKMFPMDAIINGGEESKLVRWCEREKKSNMLKNESTSME